MVALFLSRSILALEVSLDDNFANSRVETKRLVTHSGSFHADDVMAYAVLSVIYPSAVLLRTRDPHILSSLTATDIVFDVGGVFDERRRFYDHHQNDRPLRADGVPYSSVGLVWRFHGMDYLDLVIPGDTDEMKRVIWSRVDSKIMLPIDGCDNGIPEFAPISEMTHSNLSTMIEDFIPTWDQVDQDYDAAFQRAADTFGATLARRVEKIASSMRAEHRVFAAIQQSSDPRFAVIPDGLPVGRVVHEHGFDELLYLIEKSRSGEEWYVNCVRPKGEPFGQRKPLPELWAGLRDGALASVTGIPDAIFCHPMRFTCGAASLASALKLVEQALAWNPQHAKSSSYLSS